MQISVSTSKVFLDIALLIHLYTVCGYFLTAIAESSIWDRDLMACKV